MADAPDMRYKPPMFSGDEVGWSEWAFRVRAFAAEIDEEMDDLLGHAETTPDPVELVNLRLARRQAARKLMNLLIRSTSGPPFMLLRGIEPGNGFEAWRQLHLRYAARSRARQFALLAQVLRPPAFGTTIAEFENSLTRWELQVTQYQQAADEELQDAIKCQVLLEHAPPAIKTQLQLAGHHTYTALRDAVTGYLAAARSWEQHRPAADAPVPMDINALTAGGRRAQTGCYCCGEFGHLARDCPHGWPPASSASSGVASSVGSGHKGRGKQHFGKGGPKGKKGGARARRANSSHLTAPTPSTRSPPTPGRTTPGTTGPSTGLKATAWQNKTPGDLHPSGRRRLRFPTRAGALATWP